MRLRLLVQRATRFNSLRPTNEPEISGASQQQILTVGFNSLRPTNEPEILRLIPRTDGIQFQFAPAHE